MPSWHTTHFLQRQVENIGYKSDFNSALYAHMRKSTTAEDVLNAPPINELWEDVLRVLGEEAAPSNAEKPTENPPELPPNALKQGPGEVLRQKLSSDLLAKGMDDPEDQLDSWIRYAEAFVNEKVKLLVEAAGVDSMATALAETHALKQNFTDPNHLVVLYETGQAGESTSKPHLRPPALRKDHVKKMVGACLQARDKNRTQIHPSDIYLLLDAGKSGNQHDLVGCFTNADGKSFVNKERRQIVLSFTDPLGTFNRAFGQKPLTTYTHTHTHEPPTQAQT